MDLQQPSLKTFAPQHRGDFERIFDLASTLRTDETVERVVDAWARRAYELQPSPGQKLMMTGTPLTLAAQFRALFREDGGGKDSWFDADNVTSDGGTKLYSWNDRIDAAHLLFQGTSGAQCNLPVADASFASAKTATFNGSSSNYVSTRSPSAWRYLHDGSGCETVAVYLLGSTAAGTLWSTNSAVTNNGGSWLFVHQNYYAVHVTDRTDNVVDMGVAAPTLVATYIGCSFSATPSPLMVMHIKGTQAGTRVVAGTLLTGVGPEFPLMVGMLRAGLYPVSSRVRALYCFRRVLSAAEKTTYRSFIQADTGIAP